MSNTKPETGARKGKGSDKEQKPPTRKSGEHRKGKQGGNGSKSW